ncbi:MAG: hypothetical protein COB94_003320 [Gammaproteobacteria bacterium]|nr:hypothetical protein [Gammaproteobacteria bacterium]
MLDLFAWDFGLIAVLITANIYLAVIGPIVTVWHLFTFHSPRCPKHGSWEIHGEGIR